MFQYTALSFVIHAKAFMAWHVIIYMQVLYLDSILLNFCAPLLKIG